MPPNGRRHLERLALCRSGGKASLILEMPVAKSMYRMPEVFVSGKTITRAAKADKLRKLASRPDTRNLRPSASAGVLRSLSPVRHLRLPPGTPAASRSYDDGAIGAPGMGQRLERETAFRRRRTQETQTREKSA